MKMLARLIVVLVAKNGEVLEYQGGDHYYARARPREYEPYICVFSWWLSDNY